MAVFLALTFTVMVLLNVPAIQTFITGKIGSTLSQQTGAGVCVGRVNLVLTGYLGLRDVLISTPELDTMVFAGKINVNMNILKILRKNIHVSSIEIENFRATILKDNSGRFNFDFILEALAAEDEEHTENNPAGGFNWKISVGKIILSDFLIRYRDEYEGMEAKVDLKQLIIQPEEIDLDNNGYFIDEINLAGTSVSLVMWAVAHVRDDDVAAIPTENMDVQPFPALGLNGLKIQDFRFDFNDVASGSKMLFALEELLFEPEKIDLNLRQLHLGSLGVSGLSIDVAMISDTTIVVETNELQSAGDLQKQFTLKEILPDWDFKMVRLAFENSSITFDDLAFGRSAYGMDVNHLHFENFNLVIENAFFNENETGLYLSNFSFDERSGLSLSNLRFKTQISENQFNIAGLEIITNQGLINGELSANYPSLNDLINHPEKVSVQLVIDESKINTGEIFSIAGINPMDSAIAQYANLDITFEVELEGLTDRLFLQKLNIRLPGDTKLESFGSFTNLISKPESPTVDFTIQSLETSGNDLIALAGQKYFENFRLPDNITMDFNVNGQPDKLTFYMLLKTELGNVETAGFYNSTLAEVKERFGAEVALHDIQLGQILSDSTFGQIALKANFQGETTLYDSLRVSFEIADVAAGYRNYDYKDITINGSIDGSDVQISASSNDENLHFDLVASAKLDSPKIHFNADLAVEMLNFYNLYLSEEKTAFRTHISTDGYFVASDDLGANIKISNTGIINESGIISTGEIFINSVISTSGTSLRLSSKMINLIVNSNLPPVEMAEVMHIAFNRYLGKTDTLQLPAGKEIEALANLKLTDEFRERFIPGLQQIVLDTLTFHYSSNENMLKVNFGVPLAEYNNAILQNFHLTIDARGDSLHFLSGFERLKYDSLMVADLRVEQYYKNGRMLSDISLGDSNGHKQFRFLNNVIFSDEKTEISFAENGLLMNGKMWQINPYNRIEIRDSHVVADSMEFAINNSRIVFQTTDSLQHFAASAFSLSDISALLATPSGSALFDGLVDADIFLPINKSYNGISANFSIKNLEVFGALLGDLNFELTDAEEFLDLTLNAETAFNTISAEGKIGKEDSPQPIDFSINLVIDDPSKFEVFTLNNLSEMSGKISGAIKITGTTDNPDLNGFLHFDKTSMRVNALNMTMQMPDEKLVFNTKEVLFNRFTLLDENKTELVVDGKMDIGDLSNPVFGLKIDTKGFQPINSTIADNDLLYGSLIMDAAITISGDMELPVVDASITIQRGTNLTYVLPGSEIELVSAEGVVNFVNPSYYPDSIFNPEIGDYLTDSIISRVSGVDLNVMLQLDPLAKFTVMIDPTSGDYASVSGSANLNITVDPGGGQTITGVFEVTEGIYSLSFYGLVKRTFTFEPGSAIAWSGDPLNANMNFTAKHTVRTQSLALVANESAGITDAERNMFRQRLPYEVLLNMNGFLSEPVIGFRIELPEKYLINYPQVASKLTLLNSGQMDSELNKQVFALLVTGSFIADNPFASTGGSAENFVTTAARNSVNGILAEQLNRVSNRYIRNVDVNFGLTSYEDFTGDGSQTRTELDVQVSKKLLNDRLTIEASGTFDVEGNRQYSSTSTGHTYGEFSATYDLTENGDYRLRVFRENAYDLFDGEVAYSGIAFIIQKSFNALFKRTPKPGKPAFILLEENLLIDENGRLE